MFLFPIGNAEIYQRLTSVVYFGFELQKRRNSATDRRLLKERLGFVFTGLYAETPDVEGRYYRHTWTKSLKNRSFLLPPVVYLTFPVDLFTYGKCRLVSMFCFIIIVHAAACGERLWVESWTRFSTLGVNTLNP